jgi:hypothetical protein
MPQRRADDNAVSPTGQQGSHVLLGVEHLDACLPACATKERRSALDAVSDRVNAAALRRMLLAAEPSRQTS